MIPFPPTRKSAIRCCSNFSTSKTNTPKAIWKRRSSGIWKLSCSNSATSLRLSADKSGCGSAMNGFGWTWCSSIGGCVACVIIDLKIGELVHADIGQMNLYCNFAREHWMQPGENPPVGLILCAGKNDALARYAMEGLHNKMLVREYLTALPKESALAAEVGRTRELLEQQAESAPDGAQEDKIRLRSAVGERGKWSGGGEKRLAERSRSATPPPSRRRKPAAAAAHCQCRS